MRRRAVMCCIPVTYRSCDMSYGSFCKTWLVDEMWKWLPGPDGAIRLGCRWVVVMVSYCCLLFNIDQLMFVIMNVSSATASCALQHRLCEKHPFHIIIVLFTMCVLWDHCSDQLVCDCLQYVVHVDICLRGAVNTTVFKWDFGAWSRDVLTLVFVTWIVD